MKRFTFAVIFSFWVLPAFAQTGVLENFRGTNKQSVEVSATNPLPVTSSGSSNVTIIAPLGTGAPAAGVTTTLDSTDAAALQSIVTNTASSTPAGTNVIGYISNDPCAQATKTNLAISQNGTSSAQLVALSGSTTIYVCSLSVIAAGATTVAFTTGTGSACGTNNAAVIGSTTANIANSMSFAANGGMTLGNGGSTIAKGAASGELCMINGSNVYVSGNLTYVQQ